MTDVACKNKKSADAAWMFASMSMGRTVALGQGGAPCTGSWTPGWSRTRPTPTGPGVPLTHVAVTIDDAPAATTTM